MFNVVTDQLKVSQGWVRCGQCADVFDASLHLQNESVSPRPQAYKVAETESLRSDIAAADIGYVSYAEEVTKALKTPDEKLPSAFMDAPSLLPTQAVELVKPGVVDARDDVSSEALGDVSNDVSFVIDARRQAFWRKPLVRVVLGLLALLLISLLVLQVAVMQRDTLAAIEPRLKPVLQMLCERMACHVGPVRQIEAIVIDSSSFNKVNEAGTYRLSFTLKNTGAAAVAMPSLEVTLTDTQDQPVLRSVLSPAQFGAANGMLAASAEFSGTLNLQVSSNSTPSDPATTSGEALRVAGYRLLAFYP
jgi:archaellum component FlaG (FlaF/FlaG flagellin family)